MSDNVPQPPRVIPVPSDRLWFDPRLITAATQLKTTDYTGAAGQVILVAPSNPGRMAVGFAAPQMGGSQLVSPWPDVNVWLGITVAPGNEFKWYDLFRYTALVTGPWYAYSTTGIQIRVLEVFRAMG